MGLVLDALTVLGDSITWTGRDVLRNAARRHSLAAIDSDQPYGRVQHTHSCSSGTLAQRALSLDQLYSVTFNHAPTGPTL